MRERVSVCVTRCVKPLFFRSGLLSVRSQTLSATEPATEEGLHNLIAVSEKPEQSALVAAEIRVS